MYSLCASCLLCISVSMVLASINTTETDVLNSTTTNTTIPPYLLGKHESLYTCLASYVEPEGFQILPNGSVFVKGYNLTLQEAHYILKDNDSVLTFCIPEDVTGTMDKEHLALTSYLTVIGLGISMIGLFLHLVVFSVVKDLRNRPGWNLAALCASLFISYLLLLLIGSNTISENRDTCVAFASLTHFFLFSSFLWMTIMSYDVFITLQRATGRLRVTSTHFSIRKFVLYCLFAFGISLLFTVFAILVNVTDIAPAQYRPEFQELCWFSQKIPLLIFFAGPVIALSCINFLLFGISAYIIHSNKRRNDHDAQRSVVKRRYLMYFRLSAIMGITWIAGIAANIANADWVWCVFVLLNTLQGFFIFLAFTCTKKVKKFVREKIYRSRINSQQTLTTPTFQSYCNYSNSIEKDVEKVVECSKEKIDTIIIHL